MQRRSLVPALAVALALLLSACSGAPEGDGLPDGVGSDGPLPSVTGGFGEKPELTFPDEDPAANLQVSVLSEGDGDVVETGDLLLADYLGQVWGGDVFDNSYDRGAPSGFPIGVGGVVPGWDTGLVGQKVGSRVLLSIPPDLGYGESGNPAANIGGEDTLAFVVDIVASYSGRSAGDADATPTAEADTVAPEIDGALGAPVSISIPEGATAPTGLSTTLLASGTGDDVVAGALVVQYAATFWDNSSGESTWELGQPSVVQVGSGGPFDGLVGIPVGSRALLQLPATADQPAIAVVVDVIAQSEVS